MRRLPNRCSFPRNSRLWRALRDHGVYRCVGEDDLRMAAAEELEADTLDSPSIRGGILLYVTPRGQSVADSRSRSRLPASKGKETSRCVLEKSKRKGTEGVPCRIITTKPRSVESDRKFLAVLREPKVGTRCPSGTPAEGWSLALLHSVRAIAATFDETVWPRKGSPISALCPKPFAPRGGNTPGAVGALAA